MEAIQTAVSGAVVNIIVAAIGLLATFTSYGIYRITENTKAQTALIKSQGGVIKSSEERRKLENAVADVELLTRIEVGATEQTKAKELREEVKIGLAAKSELERLAEEAKLQIESSIPLETRKIIAQSFGSFERYVSRLIEEQVLALKSRAEKHEGV